MELKGTQEPLSVWLIRELFRSEDEMVEQSQPMDDREFIKMLALIVAGLALFAAFVGPFGFV